MHVLTINEHDQRNVVIQSIQSKLGQDVCLMILAGLTLPVSGTGFSPYIRFDYCGRRIGLALHSDGCWIIFLHTVSGPRRIGHFNPQIKAREQFFALCEEAVKE